MSDIDACLKALRWPCTAVEPIREKDGVMVARIRNGNDSAILKWFSAGTSRREIENYNILAGLHVPTLRIFASSDDAIIMEDMASPACRYRLAEECDMDDADIARRLAGWYRKLHMSGFDYVRVHGAEMYGETSLFTPENISAVKLHTGLSRLPVWKLLEDNFDVLSARISSAPMTITYNDFYYTNMAVSRDSSAAIMFDYNLLGKGHAYSDIRNVTYSLSESAVRAFCEAYGEYDFSREAAIDAVVSPIVTLHFAYGRAKFPDWALPELENLKHGYINAVEALLSDI